MTLVERLVQDRLKAWAKWSNSGVYLGISARNFIAKMMEEGIVGGAQSTGESVFIPEEIAEVERAILAVPPSARRVGIVYYQNRGDKQSKARLLGLSRGQFKTRLERFHNIVIASLGL